VRADASDVAVYEPPAWVVRARRAIAYPVEAAAE